MEAGLAALARWTEETGSGPPVWVGGMADAAVRRAAWHGYGLLLPQTLTLDYPSDVGTTSSDDGRANTVYVSAAPGEATWQKAWEAPSVDYIIGVPGVSDAGTSSILSIRPSSMAAMRTLRANGEAGEKVSFMTKFPLTLFVTPSSRRASMSF